MGILVVGGGSMGRRRLRDLTHLKPGEVMLLEPAAERCAEVAHNFGVPGYRELAAVPERDVRAVVVSTPPALHEPYVRWGMERGLAVFAEVPFLLQHAQLRALAERHREAVVGVSHTIRYYPPYRLICDLLARQEIGRPLYLEYSLGNYLPDWHPYEDYRKFYAHDQSLGGAGMDMLVHEISAIQWWMGTIAKVQARLAKVSGLAIEGPDVHDALLEFASGAVGYFHHDVVERGTLGRHIRIVGEEGTIEWHQNQPAIRLYRDGKEQALGFERASEWTAALEASRTAAELARAARRTASGTPPSGEAPSFTYESCYLREMRHFLAAAEGRAPYTGCTLAEELANLAAFEALLESARQGRALAVGAN